MTTSDYSRPNKVLVIGCCLTGYAVVRALSQRDLHIVAVTYSAERDVAHLSRHVSEVAHSPVPESEREFVDYLISNADRWGGALILETADRVAVILSKYKKELSKYYRIATPDWSALSVFVEKEKTYALAEQLGIPHPKSFYLEPDTEVPDVLFPCILKPVRGFEFAAKFQRKNFQVNDETELKEKLKLCRDAALPMILQEIIPGPDENLYKMQGYVNSKGTTVGKFFYRKLRQNPPRFGIARVGVSVERYPEVEKLTDQLLHHTSYRGYFSNEFKLDPRDGQLKLIENNCRMPRSGMLATTSGVNFPWLMFQDLVLDIQSDVTEYNTGTYWIDLWSDMYNLVASGDIEDISLRDYVAPYLARDKVFSDLKFSDLSPFIRVVSNNSKRLWQDYLKRRASRDSADHAAPDAPEPHAVDQSLSAANR